VIPFHKVLISTGIGFCALFALWALVQGSPVLALAFGAAAVALGYYLRHLRRFLGR